MKVYAAEPVKWPNGMERTPGVGSGFLFTKAALEKINNFPWVLSPDANQHNFGPSARTYFSKAIQSEDANRDKDEILIKSEGEESSNACRCMPLEPWSCRAELARVWCLGIPLHPCQEAVRRGRSCQELASAGCKEEAESGDCTDDCGRFTSGQTCNASANTVFPPVSVCSWAEGEAKCVYKTPISGGTAEGETEGETGGAEAGGEGETGGGAEAAGGTAKEGGEAAGAAAAVEKTAEGGASGEAAAGGGGEKTAEAAGGEKAAA